jgi:hypothetical protein
MQAYHTPAQRCYPSRDSAPAYRFGEDQVRGSLRCGISVRPSAMGQSRPGRSKPHHGVCPLRLESGHTGRCLAESAWCQRETLPFRPLGKFRSLSHCMSAPVRRARFQREMMTLSRRRLLSLAAGAAAYSAVSQVAWAQSYPTRPVRVLEGFGAGSSADLSARSVNGCRSGWVSILLSRIDPVLAAISPPRRSYVRPRTAIRCSPALLRTRSTRRSTRS